MNRKLIFTFCFVLASCGLTAHCSPVNQSDKGLSDLLDTIWNLGDPSKCATKQGHQGHCSFFSCSNVENQTEVAKCPGSTIFNCCPETKAKEVFPQNIKDCGLRPENMIVGGEEADPHSWPWAVALYRVDGLQQYFQCGGSIINEQYVMTAAHCIKHLTQTLTAKDFKVKVGAHKLSNSGEFRELEAAIVHENYDPQVHNDDIALLKLKEPFNFDADIEVLPVCLPSPNSDLGHDVGDLSTLVGWGVHDQNEISPSNVLYEVEVPISDPEQCKSAYTGLLGNNSKFNWNNVVCASYKEGGKDSCQGDSGGPMTISSGGVYYQTGVVSFGYGCAQKDYPGVYTAVSRYLNWLGAHM